MDLNARMIEVLKVAEKALAALAAEAMGALDYAQANALAEVAQRVADAAKPAPAGSGLSRGDIPGGSSHTSVAIDLEGADTNDDGRTVFRDAEAHSAATGRGYSSRPLQVAHSPSAALKKKQYPRFKREGDDTLVKIGWSKSERSQYEHRSPRRVADLLIDRIADVANDGKRFTTDELLPLRDTDNNPNGEVPSYQVYLCLAWLVMEGIIDRHGRQGYTLPNDAAELPAKVERAWAALPRR